MSDMGENQTKPAQATVGRLSTWGFWLAIIGALLILIDGAWCSA
ncbi:hypothetical protein [Vulcanisaeta sp. JCM 16159]